MTETFCLPVRVYYEDTDAGGVVYYANYLKFFERARTEWLRSRGHEQDRLAAEENVLFAITAVNVEYRQPARFNDLLCVTATVTDHSRVSFVFEQEIYRDHVGGELLSTATVKAACVDVQTFRPKRMPEAILTELAE